MTLIWFKSIKVYQIDLNHYLSKLFVIIEKIIQKFDSSKQTCLLNESNLQK